MKRMVLLTAFAILAVLLFVILAMTAAPPVLDARDLDSLTIYAYRDWQSTGVTLVPRDNVTIRARGSWTYTPNEWHGPLGHARFRSPQFYPLPNVPGGALIGKIGDTGAHFYVGASSTRGITDTGMLYLRIDDDILSDNEGQVQVDVTVIRPKERQ